MPHELPDLFPESLDNEQEEVGRSEIPVQDVRAQVERRNESERPAEEGCLGCGLVSESPVTLRNGVTVCTACPDWRHECEVRHLVAMSADAQESYLAGVETCRGRTAKVRLMDDLRAISASENGVSVEWRKG